MTEKGCDNCYYTYFDERAYPCSLCIRGIERTDQWQPSKKTKAESVTYNPTSVNNIWEKPTNPYVPNEQTETQTLDDIGRQIQDAYDKGLLSDADAVQAWYEAVKTEPQTITIEGKMSLNEWRKICPENPQFKDEPQTDCSWKKGE